MWEAGTIKVKVHIANEELVTQVLVTKGHERPVVKRANVSQEHLLLPIYWFIFLNVQSMNLTFRLPPQREGMEGNQHLTSCYLIFPKPTLSYPIFPFLNINTLPKPILIYPTCSPCSIRHHPTLLHLSSPFPSLSPTLSFPTLLCLSLPHPILTYRPHPSLLHPLKKMMTYRRVGNCTKGEGILCLLFSPLPYPSLPYPALPHPTLRFPTLPYPTLLLLTYFTLASPSLVSLSLARRNVPNFQVCASSSVGC